MAQYGSLLVMYDVLSRSYPGWSLDDVRDLSVRERKNWLELVKWRNRRE